MFIVAQCLVEYNEREKKVLNAIFQMNNSSLKFLSDPATIYVVTKMHIYHHNSPAPFRYENPKIRNTEREK